MIGIEVAMFGVLLLYCYYLLLCFWQQEKFNESEEAFGLPDNFSPGEIGYLEKGRFDFELFAAEAFFLEAEGYIQIKEESPSYTFECLRKPDDALPKSSRLLMEMMFSEDPSFTLARFNQNTLRSLVKRLERQYLATFQSYYRYRAFIVFSTVSMSLLTLALPLIATLHDPVQMHFRLLILIGSLILFAALWFAMRLFSAGLFGSIQQELLMKYLLMTIGMSLGFFCLHWEVMTLICINLSVGGILLCFKRVSRMPSRDGYKVIRRINGFKAYLSRLDNYKGFISQEDVLREFDRSAPYAFALAKEFPLIRKYQTLLEGRADHAGDPSVYFKERFELYVKIAQMGEWIYGHNRVIQPRLTLVTEGK